MDDTLDLSSAALKLSRACEHMKELEGREAASLDPNLYSLILEPDSQSGQMRVNFTSHHQTDKGISTIIGDAIGNLRSSLDYIAVALIAPITGKPESVGFPFADDAKGFSSLVTKSSFAVCTDSIKKILIEQVQAYKGGKGESLWILNKLRNIDKHRFLVATQELASIRASFRVGGVSVENYTYRVVAGQNGTVVASSHGIQFTDQPRPVFEIRIHEPPYAFNTSALPFLHRAVSDVEKLLSAIKIVA